MTSAAGKVADWARKARAATWERDRWIVTMSAEGASLREIAKAAGMTHSGVARVLKRAG